jgi:hypothetical protein
MALMITSANMRAWADRHGIGEAALRELEAMISAGGRDQVAPDAVTRPGPDAARLAVDQWGGMLLRNNSGVAKDPNGRPVRYGLGNDSARLNEVFKSSDYIGITPPGATCGPGRFLAVEWKPAGWRFMPGDLHSQGQANFLARVNQLGGIGIFATHGEDIRRHLWRTE